MDYVNRKVELASWCGRRFGISSRSIHCAAKILRTVKKVDVRDLLFDE
jgi:hypothetical protein